MRLADFSSFYQGRVVDALTAYDAQLMQPIYQTHHRRRRAILLLHGFSSTPAVFREFSPFLSHYDALFIPALPGHASTLADFSRLNAEALLEYVGTLGLKITQDFDEVTVVGLSMGGVLAYHLACEVKLHHLYLLAPAFDLNISSDLIKYLCHFLHTLGFRYLPNRAGSMQASAYYEIAYQYLPLTAIQALMALIKQVKVNTAPCPTTLFLGEHDSVIDTKAVAKRFLHQTQVATKWLRHSAHVLPLDADKDIILAALK